MESPHTIVGKPEVGWFSALTEELEEFLTLGGVDDLPTLMPAHRVPTTVNRFATFSMRQTQSPKETSLRRCPIRPGNNLSPKNSKHVRPRRLLTRTAKAKSEYDVAKKELLKTVDEKFMCMYDMPGSTDGDVDISILTSNGRTDGGITLTSEDEARRNTLNAITLKEDPMTKHTKLCMEFEKGGHKNRQNIATPKHEPRFQQNSQNRTLVKKVHRKMKAAL